MRWRLIKRRLYSFNGRPEALQDASVYMFDLKYSAAELMKIPLGGDKGETAGPVFGP